MKPQLERLESRDTPATLSIANSSLLEGNAGLQSMAFTVALSEPSAAPVQAWVNTGATREATPGSDYKPTSAVLTFAPGETVKTFNVPIVGDAVGEVDERILATISSARGATIADGQAEGTIVNDDATHGASISLSGGVLTIQGTSERDGVLVHQLGGTLYVHYSTRDAAGNLLYQQTTTVAAAGVSQIEFFGGEGNDTFADYSPIFSSAFGEGGDDVLLANFAQQ